MSRVQRLVWLASMSALLCGVAFWARDAFPLSAQAAPADAIHRVGGDVSAPRLIEKIEPNYTEEARDAKLEGTVVLSCEVHPDGRAHNVQVARGLGLGLDEQAVAAIESWSFAPGLKDGRPVIVAATVEVNFRLL